MFIRRAQQHVIYKSNVQAQPVHGQIQQHGLADKADRCSWPRVSTLQGS